VYVVMRRVKKKGNSEQRMPAVQRGLAAQDNASEHVVYYSNGRFRRNQRKKTALLLQGKRKRRTPIQGCAQNGAEGLTD